MQPSLSAQTASTRIATTQPDWPHPLHQVRSLNSFFPFQPPTHLADWRPRRARLQRHIQISLGLWPMPERCPLNAVIHDKRDKGDYTIEKVYFESFPGFLVTGNLYRPKQTRRPGPGVLSPHGHFRDGRFHWATDEELQQQIQIGAERFASNARSPLQARCANLARLGCVVFHYDMLGYADSQQISHTLAHGQREQRRHMNHPQRWGFYSPQAESRLQSIMGLQTWNSIRSLDFLCGLPDVDADRIGVTGASGGGTQTFLLCALDPRPSVAFPAVMVSTAMQGGCTCENACNLRLQAGNVEFAALFAPQPLGLTAADDWTREMSSHGFPELQQLYRLYADANPLTPSPQLWERLDFPHNFNQVSREAMYGFFSKHLGLGETPAGEREIEPLPPAELTVFNEQHPQPVWNDELEKDLLQHWLDTCNSWTQLPGLTAPDHFDHLQQSVSAALRSIVSHPPSRLKYQQRSVKSLTRAGRTAECTAGVLAASDVDLEFPLNLWSQASLQTAGLAPTIVLRVAQTPLSTATDELAQNPGWTVALEQGAMMAEILLLPQDETGALVGNSLTEQHSQVAAYTFGYNRPVLAWRVSQVLFAIEYLGERFPGSQITLQATQRDPSVVAALAFAAADSPRVVALDCQLQGFRFADVTSLADRNFLPGGARYGDLPGFLATRYNRRIQLGGETESSVALLRHVMRARGCLHQLSLNSSATDGEQD